MGYIIWLVLYNLVGENDLLSCAPFHHARTSLFIIYTITLEIESGYRTIHQQPASSQYCIG